MIIATNDVGKYLDGFKEIRKRKSLIGYKITKKNCDYEVNRDNFIKRVKIVYGGQEINIKQCHWNSSAFVSYREL